MAALDKVDRRILYSLDCDARASYSAIARDCGLNHDKVRYRVERMLQQGVIYKLHSAVDMAALGYTMYSIRLKLFGATEETRAEIIDYLVNENLVTWVVGLEGNFDIGIALRIKSIGQLHLFLESFREAYSEFISKSTLQIVVRCEYLSRDHLIDRKVRARVRKHQTLVEGTHKELDFPNCEILKELGQNARVSAADIARTFERSNHVDLQLSREAVLYRIRSMEKSGLIHGSALVLNPEKMDGLLYKVVLYPGNVTTKVWNKCIENCRKHPRVVYLTHSLGEWDFELDIEAKSVAQYREIMTELTRAHPHTIRDYSAVLITQIHKYDTSCALG